ncbi:unnamed protein product [Rotaria sp. Silwood2]|nr:unnamed protein product [Rotaria sp. Silwood2]CAF3925813.1 unnamed protein product [Rotaria sp. Silwood2]CAF4413275.1 unnamed protein product [Rotaria sp. Silwood2]
MSNTNTFSSSVQTYYPTEIPSNWIDCPRKSNIIAGKFIAFKTPLDDRYKTEIPIHKLWTCNMLIKHIKDDQKNLGLVIDLTNTKRYYRSDIEFIQKNIHYEKLSCQGHNEAPSDEQIDFFIQICHDFINTNPNDIIGVHCTHGFNRTGINVAIDLFAAARSPGIYKQDYLDKLIEKFSTKNFISILAPLRPVWCLENKIVTLNEKKRKYNDKDDQKPNKVFHQQNSNPVFAVDLIDVKPICFQSIIDNIRLKCQQMCGWNRSTFPGSQPVSMDYTNYQTIFLSPYMVSWKADGTRYMMLIESENKIYMLDRNNDVFQINHLYFPKDSDCTRHLTNTLIDGEFVIDNDHGIKIYRYLVYDIVIYENENVGQRSFTERLDIIRHSIVNIRNEAIAKGHINKSLEPFSIRNKEFWDLSTTSKLLSPAFQSKISHGCDGLPYHSGRSTHVFKWKENNTIDFRLQIRQTRGSQEKNALLYVHGMSKPFASMRYSPELDQYKNQIIECYYHSGEWYLYRHRPDKLYPNALTTADGVTTAIKRPITKDILCSLIEENIAFNNY